SDLQNIREPVSSPLSAINTSLTFLSEAARVFMKGRAFSVLFERNRFRTANFLLKFCISLTILGGCRDDVAFTSEGSALMPCFVTRRLGHTSVGIFGGFPPQFSCSSMLCGESDLTITNVIVFVIVRGPSPIVTSNGISPNGHDSSPKKPTRGVLESTRRDLIDAFNIKKQCLYITSHELPLSKYAMFTGLPDMYTLITTRSNEPSFRMGGT
nr:hypothetical protein [Tanacetum cinerariifolium]